VADPSPREAVHTCSPVISGWRLRWVLGGSESCNIGNILCGGVAEPG